MTPPPNLQHATVQSWLYERLASDAAARPEIIREVLPVSRLITRALGWIVDPRSEPAPSMTARVRGEAAWIERVVPPGGTWATDLLPGLALDLSTIFTD